ncbi:hypothetical protein Daus18300_000546 [Diaporthe australafricana]|uniref:Uncharacterized protein n=1 Tax=Diaporthe australafricana TaxID=127596 RepID=A0ABR3Y3L7_9PEZI
MLNLCPDKVQPDLNDTSLSQYKQAQENLRMVCLVSRRTDAVARQFLYRTAVINNADVLVCFLHSLDRNKSLGQQVKHLWLVVPFHSQDPHYRKPDVSILESSSRLSKITDKAAEKSDTETYMQAKPSMDPWDWQFLDREWGRYENNSGIPTFTEWIEAKGSEVLSLMYIETLYRTNKVESLCFGKISHSTVHFTRPFLKTCIRHEQEQSVVPVWKYNGTSVPFLANLKSLQLLGEKDRRSVVAWSMVEPFLPMPGLQVLKALYDNRKWFTEGGWKTYKRATSDDQCASVTCVDLEQSQLKVEDITEFCTIYPSLECLSVSMSHRGQRGTMILNFEQLLSEEKKFLSTSLAKLEHLTKLVLDLDYEQDVRPLLGPHGALSLAGLDRLVTLQLPLHFLVEMPQPANNPAMTDLRHALPSSVEHLTLTADWGCVQKLGLNGESFWSWWSYIDSHDWADARSTYRPRHAMLDLLESVYGYVAGHFRNLKGVSYCYRNGDGGPNHPCRCVENYTCIECDLSQGLNLYTNIDDSAARIKNISSSLEDQGILVSVVERND